MMNALQCYKYHFLVPDVCSINPGNWIWVWSQWGQEEQKWAQKQNIMNLKLYWGILFFIFILSKVLFFNLNLLCDRKSNKDKVKVETGGGCSNGLAEHLNGGNAAFVDVHGF